PAERMDYDNVKGRRLGRARFDHTLELRPAVVGRRGTGLNKGLDKLKAARFAPGFALPPLVGNGNLVFGLPRGRDTQIESGPHGNGWRFSIHLRAPFVLRRSTNGRTSSTRSWMSLGTSLSPLPFSMRTRP